MLFSKLSFLSALSGPLAVAALETHGGVDFEVRFNWGAAAEDTPIKDAYETEAARQASQRLREAIAVTGIASACPTSVADGGTSASLYALKDCITAVNPAAFFDLLAEDIEEANVFWDKVVTESTQDRTKWVAARTYVRGYFEGSLSALGFASWTLSDKADAANSHANPEHYWKNTVLSALGSQSSEIFEGWGGVRSSFGMKRTNFTVPAYSQASFGSAEYPTEWAIDSSFLAPFQRIGPKELAYGDGQTYGVLHIAVRDVVDNGRAGVEVYAAVWYPPWDQADAADQAEFINNYLRDESEHMVVEIVNLSLQARADLTAA
ncbi:hypothetical protein GQ53DRAFT_746443 [Thozetella sp. PMI_491]|nr:hypothetical protein GQ53DRAFT_746443 [Thozetella sp. PMI_491]